MPRNILCGIPGILASLALLGGCASGPASAPPSPVAPTAAPPSARAPSPVAPTAALPSASPDTVAVTRDVTYSAPDTTGQAEQLDVYAPVRTGPWPVVVVFHGGPPTNTKSTLAVQARAAAEQGFVVFVPSWGHLATASDSTMWAQGQANGAEGACAVAYARSHAAQYGGDPSRLVVFGHSAGANLAVGLGFGSLTPTPGCPGGSSLGPIHALVTWDGDWMLTDPMLDDALPAEPALMDASGVRLIASNRTLRVVMLMSGIVAGYARDLADPAALKAFFAVRDPSGSLRARLQAMGALDDNAYDVQELQRLFMALLKAQGNPVTLTTLPETTHDSVGSAMGPVAMAVLLAALREAAA